MPVYQYACTDCGEALEVRQSFTEDALTVCPACEGRLRKVLSAVGVVFKGSGFYRTDSRNGTAHSDGAGATDGGNSSDSSSSERSGASEKAARSSERSTTEKKSASEKPSSAPQPSSGKTSTKTPA